MKPTAKPHKEKTYLARFLDRLIDQTGILPKELASRLGIVKSHLSHIFSGKRRSFNYETVAKMVAGVSEDPEIQGEFLKSYLLDQCTDENRALIHIQVAGKTKGMDSLRLNEDTTSAPDPVDRFCAHLRHLDIQEATLEVLRRLIDQAENSESLRNALSHLADLEISPKRRGKAEKA